MRKTATCTKLFKTKKMSNGETVIEGWANAATVDRGKEVINQDAWKNLENYKKNGIILFNHDPDKPIGKMLDIRATEDGLWLKAKISKSKDPFVSYIRDLVDEGILNAFSVGFDPIDEEKNHDGVLEVKALDLYEVSVVTLPMNQDSIFSLSSKSFKGMEYKEVKNQVLKQKGAMVAAAAQEKLGELEKAGELDKEKLVQMVAEKSGADAEQVAAVLAGTVSPVPEPVLAALAEVLGLDVAELQKMDAADLESEEPSEVEKKDEPKETTEKQPEEEKSVKAKVDVIAIQIPKDVVADAEAAAKWAVDNGWEAGEVTEDDTFYMVAQADRGMFTEGETALDLGDGVAALVGVKKPGEKACDDPKEVKADACQECVSKYIPELIKEGKPQDQAAAIAYSKCEAECGESKEKSLVPESEKAAIPAADDGLPKMDENPLYQQGQQTNILLGALIQEVKTMSEKLDRLQMPAPTSAPAPESELEDLDETTQKMLEVGKIKLAKLKDNLRQYME